MSWLKLSVSERMIQGSAVRNAGGKKPTLVAILSKVMPFQAKAFPIWTRQLICASVQEFKSLSPLLQAMRLSEFALQL